MSETTVKTGERCQVSGVYKCRAHPTSTIPLAIRNVAPPCPNAGRHATTWVLQRRA